MIVQNKFRTAHACPYQKTLFLDYTHMLHGQCSQYRIHESVNRIASFIFF